MIKFFLIALLGIGAVSFSHAQEIQMKNLHGQEGAPYLKEISAFYNAIYREAPYFYDASEAAWDGYIQSYVNTPESVICLALEGETLIGVAIGTPLAKASKKYKMAFSEHPNELNSLFYLGELAMKSEYRQLGIGKKLYGEFERLVREKEQFSGICIWQLQSEEKSASLLFWQELGFACRPEIHFEEFWKPVSEAEKIPHPMVCWIKSYAP